MVDYGKKTGIHSGDEPLIMKFVDGWFLARTITTLVGFLLFYSDNFYLTRYNQLTYFSFMFDDLTLYGISPLVPLLHALAFGVAFVGLRRDVGIARLLCVVLLFIDIFALPVGTVISLILIVYLVLPSTAKWFSPIGNNTKSYRIIGVLLLVVSVGGLFVTTGTLSNVVPQSETPNIQMLAIDKIDTATIDINDTMPVDIIVELYDTSSMMQAVSMQSVVLQDVQLLGGENLGSTTRVLNAIETRISADNILQIAQDPNVKRITKNEPVVQLQDIIQPQSIEESKDYVWAPIKKIWGGVSSTGKGVVIAVVDSGIDDSIEALQRNGKSIVIGSFELYGEWVHWHGTAVATTIASQGTAEYPDIKGVAPDVDLLNVEVFLPSGQATYFDIIKGWEWVAQWKESHPDRYVICSNSLGVPVQNEEPGMLDTAADNMVIRYGIPMVVASGNNAPEYRVCSPGMAEYVLTVGAVDAQGNIAPFSCRGPVPGVNKPDVCALGVDVPVFYPSDQLLSHTPKKVSGTSFSTPIVAGQMALLAAGTDYTPEQLYNAIRMGATDAGAKGFDTDYGYGISNINGAVAALQSVKPTRFYTYIFALLPIVALAVMFFPELDKKLNLY